MHPLAKKLLLSPAFAVLLAACNQPPPSWQKLLADKITEQYPTFQVTPTPDGDLMVARPGRAPLPVDVKAIAQFCQRGAKDCGYATDQMLLELREK
jgi:hypothetical protein